MRNIALSCSGRIDNIIEYTVGLSEGLSLGTQCPTSRNASRRSWRRFAGAPPWTPGSIPTGSPCSNSGESCPAFAPCTCRNSSYEEPFASLEHWRQGGRSPCTNPLCADSSRSRRSVGRLRNGGEESSGTGTTLQSFLLTHGDRALPSLCSDVLNSAPANLKRISCCPLGSCRSLGRIAAVWANNLCREGRRDHCSVVEWRHAEHASCLQFTLLAWPQSPHTRIILGALAQGSALALPPPRSRWDQRLHLRSRPTLTDLGCIIRG